MEFLFCPNPKLPGCWEQGVWVLWPRRKSRGHMPGVQALESSRWQQVCCNQVYCHPLALNTSPQGQGENKPRVSFSRRVPLTPCHKSWERLTCKWVRTPRVWGSSRACSRAQGLWTTGKGCSEKSLEVPGKKKKQTHCRNTKFLLMRQVGNSLIVLKPLFCCCIQWFSALSEHCRFPLTSITNKPATPCPGSWLPRNNSVY